MYFTTHALHSGLGCSTSVYYIFVTLDKHCVILWEDTREASITRATNIVTPNVIVGDICNVAAAGKTYEGRIVYSCKYCIYMYMYLYIIFISCIFPYTQEFEIYPYRTTEGDGGLDEEVRMW